MMSEKFSLRWNDFQSVVSHSFSLLREEADLSDVTLLSEDQTQLAAHRVVLSASSEFFRNIFRSNKHSHPLLYLGGVKTHNLQFILDYIYHGEVLICQDQLNEFLESAQKLNIKGLISDDIKEENVTFSPPEQRQNIEEKENKIVRSDNGGGGGDRIELENNDDVNEKIRTLIEKIEGGFSCKVCGKTSKNYQNHKRHVETHIDGLSFPCLYCAGVFRSRDSRNTHVFKLHR